MNYTWKNNYIKYRFADNISSNMRDGFISAIETYKDIISVSIEESSNANVVFSSFSGDGNKIGKYDYIADTDTNNFISGKISIADYLGSYNPGTLGYYAILHELGHALGLEHPLNMKDHNLDYSIMSYENGNIFNHKHPPSVPLIEDINNLLRIYNKNPTYANKYNDSISGTNGEDIIYGNQGNDVISGADSNDTIHGGKNEDIIYGNQGNDVLYGDKGDDTLLGGLGADMFIISNDNGHDIIKDYEEGIDKIIYNDTIVTPIFISGMANFSIDYLNDLTIYKM